MPDPIKALGNGHSRVQPTPGMLVGPSPVIPMTGVTSTPAGPHVIVRFETVTGMFAVLLAPDDADSFAKAVQDSARQARTGLSIPK